MLFFQTATRFLGHKYSQANGCNYLVGKKKQFWAIWAIFLIKSCWENEWDTNDTLNLRPKPLGQTPNRAENSKVSFSKGRSLKEEVHPKVASSHITVTASPWWPRGRVGKIRSAAPHTVWPLSLLFLGLKPWRSGWLSMYSKPSLKAKDRFPHHRQTAIFYHELRSVSSSE